MDMLRIGILSLIVDRLRIERFARVSIAKLSGVLNYCGFWCLAILVLVATPTHAQFTTVLNIPPDPNIGSNQTIGSDTQVNLFDGGEINSFFSAGAPDGSSENIEVNILGGEVGSATAHSGSVFNISGGSVGALIGHERAKINISGGSINSVVVSEDGALVDLSNGSLSRVKASSGSILNMSGGTVDRSEIRNGSQFNISGGTVNGNIRVSGNPIQGMDSILSISGGSHDLSATIEFHSSFDLSGGLVRGSLTNFVNARGGPQASKSVLNLSGGEFEGELEYGQDGVLNISGGKLSGDVLLSDGAILNISGGEVSSHITAQTGVNVNLYGTQFWLYGFDITSTLSPNGFHELTNFDSAILNGITARMRDGSQFQFGAGEHLFDSGSTLTLILVPEPTTAILFLTLIMSSCCWRVRGPRSGTDYR